MAFTYLVSAHILNDEDRQVGAAMIDVGWPRAPRDRAEAERWVQELTEDQHRRGSLVKHHRYRVAGWSEYAR